ncbi:nuclear transport factor 2 family protein [Chitinophaga agrisoli]|uniref:Nuclear transport factor 2 family protein n=1 Tax=Chitinophaga agrisoli TaxID=2607653 RepID=A0A5B2VKW5_9BACT|nr:nuclear transport factor 2 family protein [Chitinophaga agrisoli]KAA2238897.1 nuclear transport factor 2 family protein [Chitinophaga agrisoli]
MHHLFLLSLILIPFTSFGQESDSAIISRLNRNWIASYATKDTAAMQQILADDMIMIAPKGNKLNKTDIIRNVGAADITTTAEIDSTTIRVFGQTALVTSYTHFSIQTDQQTMHGTNCYSDLYIKRKGVWQAVAAHVTLLTMQ